MDKKNLYNTSLNNSKEKDNLKYNNFYNSKIRRKIILNTSNDYNEPLTISALDNRNYTTSNVALNRDRSKDNTLKNERNSHLNYITSQNNTVNLNNSNKKEVKIYYKNNNLFNSSKNFMLNNISNNNNKFKLINDNSAINLTNPTSLYQANYTEMNPQKIIKISNKFATTNLTKNNSINSSINASNNNNNNNQSSQNIQKITFQKFITNLQNDMNKKLNDNPTNSKSKKYNTLKHAFEDLIKSLNNPNTNYIYDPILNNLLERILIGYHEVVSAFSVENRKLKQLNLALTDQYEKIDKRLLEANRNLKDKQKQLDLAEKKLSVFTENSANKKTNSKTETHDNNTNKTNKSNNTGTITVNSLPSSKNLAGNNSYNNIKRNKSKEQNNKILKFNQENIDDLDALYFYDKIEMDKVDENNVVPFIDVDKIYRDEERARKLKHAKTKSNIMEQNQGFKYITNTFQKLKEAFKLC